MRHYVCVQIVLIIFSWIAALAATVMMFIAISDAKNYKLYSIGNYVGIGAAFLAFGATMVFVSFIDDNSATAEMGWSCGIAIFGWCLQCIVGVLLVVHSTPVREEQYNPQFAVSV